MKLPNVGKISSGSKNNSKLDYLHILIEKKAPKEWNRPS